jgi:hypothetical protein
MPRVRFEPTIPVFERAKTCHALGRAAAVIGGTNIYRCKTHDTKQQFLTRFQIYVHRLV